MKDWIERYVYDVGKRLPKGQQEDIKKELHSLILDALDERVARKEAKTGDTYEATEEDVVAVLESFGPPSEVAKKYLPHHKFLIGPELFDLYKLVVMIVLMAVGIGLTVATVVSVMTTEGAYGTVILKLIGQLFSGKISAVGAVTIVFALIQYFTPENELKNMHPDSDWKVKDLPEVPVKDDQLKRSERIMEICFTAVAIIVFNLFPQVIAIYSVSEGTSVTMPIFDLSQLRIYVNYLTLLWIMQIGLSGLLLKKGRWTRLLRFFDIILNIGFLWILYTMIQDPTLLNPVLEGMPIPGDVPLDWSIAQAIKMGIRGIVAIILVTTLYEILQHGIHMIRKQIIGKS